MIEIIPNWHPFFVHFTIALFSVSCVLFLIQKPLRETEIGDNLYVFARYSLYLGVIMSILTLVAGWDAFNTVDHDTPSHVAMIDHRLWGISTFVVFLIAAIWLSMSTHMEDSASVVFVIFILIGGGLLLTAGYKGSELVYKHGLGVQSLPNAGNHGHSVGHDQHHGVGETQEKTHNEHDSLEDEHSHDSSNEGHQTHDLIKVPEEPVMIDKDGISKQALPAAHHRENIDDGHAH